MNAGLRNPKRTDQSRSLYVRGVFRALNYVGSPLTLSCLMVLCSANRSEALPSAACYKVLCPDGAWVTGTAAGCQSANVGDLCSGVHATGPYGTSISCPTSCFEEPWQNVSGAISLLSTTATVDVDVDLNGTVDTTLIVSGPTIVSASAAGSNVLDTEIVSMNLQGSGMSLIAGEGLGQGGGLPATTGTVVAGGSLVCVGGSNAGNACTSDGDCTGGGTCTGNNGVATFNVYLEVNLGMAIGYNHDPIPVSGAVTLVPCYDTNFTFSGSVDIYDAPVGGNLIARVLGVDHFTGDPPPPPPPATGACCSALLCIDALTPSECAGFDGSYHGDGSLCADVSPDCYVPALSTWGVVVMTLLLVCVGTVIVRRRVRAIPL